MKITPDVLLMDNLEKSVATIVDKVVGNTCGDIVERLIKLRTSTMFVQLVYSLDELGPLIAISVPHENFFNSAFGIWMGGFFSYGF